MRCHIILGFVCAVALVVMCVSSYRMTHPRKEFRSYPPVEHREMEDVLEDVEAVGPRNVEAVEEIEEPEIILVDEAAPVVGGAHPVSVLLKDKAGIAPGVDSKHMHGLVGRDESGEPTWVHKPLTFRIPEDQKPDLHAGYCFNTLVSDSVPMDREIKKFRSNKCESVIYDKSLPSVSVVIVFHNEWLSVLLRSIHSVLNRSSPDLLKEIIIVDDFSDKTTHPWLAEDLDRHVKYLPKTVIRRLDERHGLMRARVAGFDWTTGEIALFLDSHIEAMDGWLEPLLSHIQKNPKAIVVPVIHGIGFDDFKISGGGLDVVSFSWTLGQTHPQTKMNEVEPVPSVVMAGGLFAVSRSWFYDLGTYDKEMRLYGGEEFELGFKVWMCGGSLVVIPCSRVAHVFREPKYWAHQVYEVPGYEIARNKLRVAEVWMDEYKEIVKMGTSQLPEGVSLGPLEDQIAVRERLNCKSFKWYLDNIATDVYVPDIIESGALMHPSSMQCLDSMAAGSPFPDSYQCHGMKGTQAFILTRDGHLRAIARMKECVIVDQKMKYATSNCGGWLYNKDTRQMTYKGKCLVKQAARYSFEDCTGTDKEHFVWS